MSDYITAAPTVSELVDEQQFGKDFPAPVEASPPAESVTIDQRRAVYEHIRAVYATGATKVAIIQTARALQVPTSLVKRTLREIAAARSTRVAAAPVVTE